MTAGDWIALAALLLAAGSLVYSYRSVQAAGRSANAADESSRHSKVSSEAAVASNDLVRRSFDEEAKRMRGRAYWALYRAHNRLLQEGQFNIEGIDLAAVEDLLSIHGHVLTQNALTSLRGALNGIDSLIAYQPLGGMHVGDTEYSQLKERVRPFVRDAALSIRERWYPTEPELIKPHA